MSNFVPIGKNNPRGNEGIRVSFDKAHGEFPDHVDMVVPMPELGMADKIRVDAQGRIISDEWV